MASQEDSFNGYQLSGWWKRVGAYLLDGLILSVVYVVVFLILGLIMLSGGNNDALVLAFVLIVFVGSILITVFYYGWSMSREGEHNGQSLGKQMLHITVIREEGEEVDFWYAVKREVLVIQILFGFIFNIFTGGIATFLNYLWPLWDEKRQCLHDKMVSSRVVVSGPAAPSQTSVEEIS